MTRTLVSWFLMSAVMTHCESAPDTQLRRDPQQIVRIGDTRALPGQSAARFMSNAPSKLRNTITLVCDGVPEETQTRCPIAAEAVSDVVDSDDGVILVLRGGEAGEQELSRRVQCYRALSSVRVSPLAVGCALDVAPVDVSVRTIRSNVAVELIGRSDEQVQELRDVVRDRVAAR